jgi:glycosyltransferase involved in cell wall biosynthesis
MAPNLVIIAQGGITGSYDGVFACKAVGLRYCSYIAMAHRSTELATYRFPKIWNAVRSVFYSQIGRYITIDEEQAVRIRRERRTAQIIVVENYLPPLKPTVRLATTRESLGLPPDKIVLAVIGRIEFGQKCQDWLVDALQEREFLKDKIVVFVGEGPDIEQLRHKIDSSNNRESFRLLSWREDLEQVYAAIDALLIPSRAEGVPLVMLEALAREIPVVGVDRDGMKTWLPPSWRYEFGDEVGLKRAISSALNEATPAMWDQISMRVHEITNEKRFANGFTEAIRSFLNVSQ